MTTCVEIAGEDFLINGVRTYAGRVDERGRRIEGLLFNSRMVQAIFDDECEATRGLWAYPDTGCWDPERNTDEFCRALPVYRAHGLLAVTVGLQGGGSNYRPEVMNRFRNSAFTDEGELKPAYFARLQRVLAAADACGMVVIVSYFYWRHVRYLAPGAIERATINASSWLLASGFRNVIVEIANEIKADWPEPLRPDNVHRLIESARGMSRGRRRLLVGTSYHPSAPGLPPDSWLAAEDVTFPHGNDRDATQLAALLREFRATAAWRARPRPLVINEDSTDLANLEAAADARASWGFYYQGFGSDYADKRFSWKERGRESRYEDLSGFQTVPVNWSINDPAKRAFFERLKQITGGL